MAGAGPDLLAFMAGLGTDLQDLAASLTADTSCRGSSCETWVLWVRAACRGDRFSRNGGEVVSLSDFTRACNLLRSALLIMTDFVAVSGLLIPRALHELAAMFFLVVGTIAVAPATVESPMRGFELRAALAKFEVVLAETRPFWRRAHRSSPALP